MGWRRSAAVGLAAVGLMCGGHPAAAGAAAYHTYSCHAPDGSVTSADGWTGTTTGPDAYAVDDCGGPTGALTAGLTGQVAHLANVSSGVWGFTAAPDLRLVGATLHRHEAVPGGTGPLASYVTYIAAPTLAYDAADVLDNCEANLGCASLGGVGGASDPSSVMVIPASYFSAASQLYVVAACGGIDGQVCPPSPGWAATAQIYAADLTLEDDSPPVAASLGGGLVGGGTLTGPAEIWFRAYDQGSGVYSARLTVDGRAVSTQVIDDNGGECQTLGQASDGLRAFSHQVPCKSAVSADLTLDTSQIPDGSHTLAVSVDDAAGNVTGVYDGTIVTRNTPLGGVPQVTGILAQGQKLSANPGTWNPAPSSLAFQWLRCGPTPASCQAIPGAVEQTYTPVGADDYQRLAVDVTASDPGGTTTVRSGLVGPIADQSGSSTGAGGGIAAQGGGLTGARAPGSPGSGPGHVANGSGACASARLTVAFGSGPVGRVGLPGGATLHGALSCAGAPVAGAAVEVSIARQGDPAAPAAAEVRTGPDGRFAYVVGPGPSRAVTLSYRASADATTPAATAAARLEVTPAIGLSISPVRVRNGQTITYRGQVFGGYIPSSGLPLDVEYRDGSHWRTFDQTRARARDGRFVYRYTFRRTTIPIVYTFRVVVAAGGVSGYPYAAGASRPRSVHVDP